MSSSVRVIRDLVIFSIVAFILGLGILTVRLPSEDSVYPTVLSNLAREVEYVKDRDLPALVGEALEVFQAPASPPRSKHRLSSGGGGEERSKRRKTLTTSTTSSSLLSSKGHDILALDDESFRTTSVGTMWKWYGLSQGADNCESDLGYKLLERWRDTNQTYCMPHREGGSKVDCFFIRQNHHAGSGDNFCVASDVRVNFGQLADDQITNNVMRSYIESTHSDDAWIHYDKGLIAGNCNPVTELWQKNHFPGWNVDIMFNGFAPLPDGEDLKCEQWIEHPTLLVERDTFANFFHDSEDFVNTFLAMAIMDLSISETQIYLIDLYPKGPFWDIWDRVFNQGLPTKRAWDIKQEHRDSNLCFKQVAMGIYGPAAPTTLAAFKTECFHCTLIRAYSDTVIRGMGLQDLTHYNRKKPSKTVTVTWMARRSSVIWPERNFCDDQFFKCNDFTHLQTRTLGRMVRNDAEVVAKLRDLEKEVFPNGAQVVFQDKDYNLLSFEEQIKVDLSTDIMVGPHGAGLMHNIFLRDRAVLMELFIDGSGANKHFHNLASWYGRKYVELTLDNPVPVDDLYDNIRKEISGMDLNSW